MIYYLLRIYVKISALCWKRACTSVFQQGQLSTENITKMIPSVLSWAGDVYHWQWRTMGPGDQKHLAGGVMVSHSW